MGGGQGKWRVRRQAVAGSFYPQDPRELEDRVRAYLRDAPEASGPPPKALIAPHAGYVYSGPIAGSAYARLAPLRGAVERVVLLGPAHRVPVRGLAAPGADAFATPLGEVPLDRDALERALALPQVRLSDAAHAPEHSLEVQLPFLQVALGAFSLAPLLVGDASPDEVAEVLERLWGGPETLIVVSSDLSHDEDSDTARALDAETTRAIEALRPDAINDRQACGYIPVQGLLIVARRHGLRARTLDLRNSSDMVADAGRIVGYGAWAFA